MSKIHDTKSNREEATAERYRLIVEAAAACFVEKGFHQTSIREIAREAGISLGNLYNHFENKAALIAQIASLEADEMKAVEARLAGQGAPLVKIERFSKAYFDYVCVPENVVLAAEITSEALRNPQVAQGFLRNRERLVTLLSQVLLAGQQTGSVELVGSPDDTANLMIDLLASTGLRVAFDGQTKRRRAKKHVIATIRKIVFS